MKAIVGLFESEKVSDVVHRLMEQGFDQNSLSAVSNQTNIPDYIEGEPEEAAADGAAIGAVIGGSVGLLSSAAIATIPGFETSIVTGFMGTAGGAALGTYLGSIYSVRANQEVEAEEEGGKSMIDLLDEGNTLLVVTTTSDKMADQAEKTLNEAGGSHIGVHTLPKEEK